MQKIEGDDSNYILYSHYNSPIFFISERDVLDKRAEFTHDNIYYCLSTSVDDEIKPIEENVIRIKSFINLFVIQEDEQFFHFKGFNQVDMKVYRVFILDELT